MVIEMGCSKFVALGGAGVLRSDIQRGSLIIPNSALRDEGTSYHYQPASRYIETDPEVVRKLEAVLQKHQMKYLVGRTWTTDAIFRETKRKIRERIAENCLTVELECASFLAAARLRKVKFGQYLEASDDVCGEEWDRREISDEEKMAIREKLFWLSVEAVLSF
jgi:uridine phosphorylase